MAVRNSFAMTVLGALAAAFASAVLYGIVGAIHSRSVLVPADAFLWLALVSATVLPVTVFSELLTTDFERG